VFACSANGAARQAFPARPLHRDRIFCKRDNTMTKPAAAPATLAPFRHRVFLWLWLAPSSPSAHRG